MSTPARTRNRRGEGTRLREDLITAAGDLLEDVREGDGLSLRAVARRAGIAPQSLYLHFADKGELLGALCEARFAELAAELAAAGGTDPAARLRATCLAYCAFAHRRPGVYRVLFTDPAPAAPPDGPPDGQRGAALAVFDRAVRARTGEPGPGPSATTLCLWAALHGLVLLRRHRPGVPWPELEPLVDTLLAGLAPGQLPNSSADEMSALA